jgi:hypothetical protein
MQPCSQAGCPDSALEHLPNLSVPSAKFWVLSSAAQLVWVPPRAPGSPLLWSAYVWRRGTVPIWWGVEIKSGGVGEASIVVSARRPYRGTRRRAAPEVVR